VAPSRLGPDRQRCDDPHRQEWRTSAVDQLQERVQVEPGVSRQLVRESGREAGLEKPTPSPFLDVERGAVATATGSASEVVNGHACWCPIRTVVLPRRATRGKNRPDGDTNIFVSLPTTPSSAAAGVQVNAVWADFCAVVCAASAGVHAALVVPHYRESVTLAAAFAAAAVALAVAAVGQALLLSPAAAVAVAGLLLGVAGAYVVSRTTGIPGVMRHPEPLDRLGAATSCLEVAAAWAALWPYFGRNRS
jgi:hypothetical protein